MADLDFDRPDPDAEPEKPAGTFTLAGRDWTCRPTSALPWELAQRLTNRDTDDAVTVKDFFRGVLTPDQWDDFAAILNDPAGPISIAHVNRMIPGILGLFADRPTTQPGRSSTGRRRTGRSSAASSSSPATQRPRSVA